VCGLLKIQDTKIRHLCTIARLCLAISLQLRHILTIEKSLLNSNISSTCPHNMVNFSLLTAEIGWRIWGTPANFNGFRVLASLLHQRHSKEVNQTLHNVWPSPGLVHYIYIFGGSCPCPLTEFCQVQNSLCIQVLCSTILTALLHGTRAVGIRQTLHRWTRKGITELLLLICSTYIRRAAITLASADILVRINVWIIFTR